MLYYYHKRKNAVQTRKKCAGYDEGTVNDRLCQFCYAKVCAGDFNLERATRARRPTETDSYQIKTLIENDPHQTTREIANMRGRCVKI